MPGASASSWLTPRGWQGKGSHGVLHWLWVTLPPEPQPCAAAHVLSSLLVGLLGLGRTWQCWGSLVGHFLWQNPMGPLQAGFL